MFCVEYEACALDIHVELCISIHEQSPVWVIIMNAYENNQLGLLVSMMIVAHCNRKYLVELCLVNAYSPCESINFY